MSGPSISFGENPVPLAVTTPIYGITLPTPGGDSDIWATILNDAIVALETHAADKVLKTGDTMTGALWLPATAPSQGQQAANKTYVDAHSGRTDNPHGTTAAQVGALTQSQADARYLTPAAADAAYINITGDTMTGALFLHAVPTAALGAATKSYADNIGSSAYAYTDSAVANRVAKGGDTMSGALQLFGAPTADLHASTKKYVDDAVAAGGGGGALETFRNLLINARFTINQRVYVSGAATTGANQYTLDRWRVVTSGQNVSWTASGVDNQITAPAGGIEQVIEANNNAGGVHVLNWTGTATATVNGTSVAKGGTVSLTANTDVTVRFIGGTVLNPQFERGSEATAFERRPLAVEYPLCWRYFETCNPGSAYKTFTISSGYICSANATIWYSGENVSAVWVAAAWSFRAVKRGTPVVATYAGNGNTGLNRCTDGNTLVATAIQWTAITASPGGVNAYVAVNATNPPSSGIRWTWQADAEIGIVAAAQQPAETPETLPVNPDPVQTLPALAGAGALVGLLDHVRQALVAWARPRAARAATLAGLLALAGCGDGPLLFGRRVNPLTPQETPPIVRATDRGSASMTVISCPLSQAGATAMAEFLQTLNSYSPVVTATDQSNSRLVLNLCAAPPTAEMLREMRATRR